MPRSYFPQHRPIALIRTEKVAAILAHLFTLIPILVIWFPVGWLAPKIILWHGPF